MREFGVAPLRAATVAYLARMRHTIDVEPPYQRQGAVWSKEKQRLLLDSLLNGFDVPKIYLHERITRRRTETPAKFALIDGRQRLEAVWDYVDDKFALADDFQLLEDGTVTAGGMTFSELEDAYPDLAALLNATALDVMVIRTDDDELIEEMFSRLNEAVPLNAAEKRNGRGGPLRDVVRTLVQESLFSSRLPFDNRRYRQLDLATKFLYWEQHNGPADAKKLPLDRFQEQLKTDANGPSTAQDLLRRTLAVVRPMAEVFNDKDRLLSNVGMVSVYFLLFRELVAEGQRIPDRNDFASFERIRKLRRFDAESDLTRDELRLLEFDRLAQSPNDASALTFRLEVLRDFLSGRVTVPNPSRARARVAKAMGPRP